MVEAPAGIQIFGAMRSDPGLVRSLNEDVVAWISPREEEVAKRHGSLALVADGMGGHAAGEVASAMAADVIRRQFYDRNGPVPQVLANAFFAAHHAILEYAEKHPECRGMGTTCTALAFRDHHAWLAHIGDSRAYLLRDRVLTQLSQDQTLVAKLVSEGTMTQDEAEHSPMHNVILQALGAIPEIQPLISSEGLELRSGDVFVICSDGISGLVPDSKIAEIASRLPPQEACDALIEAALAAGGDDNASLGVFSVTTEATSKNATGATPKHAAEPTTRRIKIPIERDADAGTSVRAASSSAPSQ